MRIKIFKIAVVCIFIFLVLTLFYFQVIHHFRYRQLSEANRIRVIPQEGSRGRILDRNGDIIADNYLSYNVLFIPQQNADKEKTFAKLADILTIPKENIIAKFKAAPLAFFTPVVLAENISKRQAITIEELKSDLPGVIIQARPARFYPHGTLLAHTLGYLGEIDYWRLNKLKSYGYKSRDIVGYTGIEERYDYYLRAQEGGLQVEVDNLGRIVRVIGLKPPRCGRDIQLTIDLRIQMIIERAIKDRTASVIIIDHHSGEILAMASFPNFNPGLLVKKSACPKAIMKDPDAPLFNRAISGLYPAGSIFKIVVAAAGLETETINAFSTFNCPGNITIGEREYKCWNKHGDQNLVQAIANSCNVFFYRLGLLLGADKIYDYAVKFGLGKATQIDLPSESSGFVPAPTRRRTPHLKGWFAGDTANLSIGQGDLLVTPIQIASLAAAIANGGSLLRPHLIKAMGNQQISAHRRKSTPLQLRQETLRAIRAGLRQSVLAANATANILSIADIAVSGKTGTAQVGSGQPHAWFAGFFPSQQPKFTICVLLEHGGPSINACMVAKDIIKAMKDEGLI